MTMRKQSREDRFLLAVVGTLLVLILSYATCARAAFCSIEMIAKEAKRQHFDPAIAIAVATVESGLNMDAIGKSGEIGCFQVCPYLSSADENLFDMATNIKVGIRHLKYWQRVCPTVEGISFVNCYNSGFRHPRYPFLRPYVRKVAAIMRRKYD
jgi:Transglycosylase SLT domain